MKRFVLQCSEKDFVTPTVVHIDDLLDDAPALRSATLELSEHVVLTHGIQDGEPLTFSAVEVTALDGDLWMTEVLGERP